ncbi:chain length determinant protein tyrosine kinase EpsG [Caenimonas sp. SL110]|uniref:chain length determinant protein tyrosine kinase EpsG n=1 Tax=Caenimonas sp. SL110 TaxID=1450524 RepID=UPI0009E50496|nr:chain length determinant protein tyrosine kinase EpsG [Caenimonas sp. SL110]
MSSQIYPLPSRAEFDIVAATHDAALPIGALLVKSSRLTEDNVQRILDYQKKSGLLFGESGVAMGLLTEDDVRAALALQFGQPYVGSDSGLANELVAANDPASEAAEHLRVLRSQLMLRWFESDTRQAALAVVSASAGEGRSYIAANLAVLFSQLGKRTLLIDADMRKPRQHKMFALAGRAGLSTVLSGRAGWDAIHEIKALPSLSLLPAGAVPPNPQELLAGPGFARLITALRSTYEVILIDTPAATQWADATTIASRAGAALMVACRDATSVPLLTKVAQDMRQIGVSMVGAVLNNAQPQ